MWHACVNVYNFEAVADITIMTNMPPAVVTIVRKTTQRLGFYFSGPNHALHVQPRARQFHQARSVRSGAESGCEHCAPQNAVVSQFPYCAVRLHLLRP